jgi:hypothetical protein
MRWIPLAIVTYIVVIAQTTLGSLLTFSFGRLGRVGPDLLAPLAVYIALRGPGAVEVMLSGWILGLAIDLTTATGPGAIETAALGPMAISYAIVAGVLFKLREAVFADRRVTQMALVFVFVLLSHVGWLLAQASLAWSWQGMATMLAVASTRAIYTGVLAGLIFPLLRRVGGGLFIIPAAGRSRRGRRSLRPT